MRQQKEVSEQVLADQGRFHKVIGPRQMSTDPAPLKVKEVKVEGRRYVVCVNAEQVEQDRQKRDQIGTRLPSRAQQKSRVSRYQRRKIVVFAGK